MAKHIVPHTVNIGDKNNWDSLYFDKNLGSDDKDWTAKRSM